MPSSDRLAARRFELVAAEYVQRMGARIAARRVEKGLSQVDVARALPGKVDGSQVSRWERGLHRPNDETLERLGEILDVPLAYFMAAEPTKGETPDPFPADNGTEDRLGRLESQLAAIQQTLEGLVKQLAAAGFPAPQGELGRRATGSSPTPATERQAPRRAGRATGRGNG
jgi:transcriptional regulator with XRE-family HTH domain